MTYLKRVFLLVLLGFLSYLDALDSAYIQSRAKAFRKSLESLSWQLSSPWSVIKVTASAMGYSQVEIDAIPVSFPFLCEGKYKQHLGKLDSPEMVALINQIFDTFVQRNGSHLSKRKQNELIHAIIHEVVLEGLGLAATTTTKQLADLVARKQVSINRLCEMQVAAFFVKFHLDL